MINNRWNGERISIAPDTPVGIVQCHLSRYVWAMKYCVGETVLDVGCGTGYGTWLLGTMADDIVGIDKSLEAIDEARREFNGSFVHMEIENAKDHMAWHFSRVVAFEVLEHIDDVDVGLETIASLLNEGGGALLSFPIHQPSSYHHFRDYDIDDWLEIVSRRLQVRGMFYQPLENSDAEHGNVSIRRLGDQRPVTGVVIFETCKG